MNFNHTLQPDYNLNESLVAEVINLYGVLTNFMVVEKINRDDVVFGDYSHIKTDGNAIFDLYALPEIMEEWDNGMSSFGEYGLVNMDVINLFVSRKDLDNIYGNFDEGVGFKSVLGNLLVLPNNKIVEITDIKHEVPGVNNMFTMPDVKSVYKLTCKTYDHKLINEVDSVHVTADSEYDGDYETLDNYFNELVDLSVEQDNEAEVENLTKTIIKTGDIDEVIEKPIIDKTEDYIFGNF